MPTSTTSGGSVEVRHARREAEHEAAEHEQDRVRDPQRLREQEQRSGGDEQHQKLKLFLSTELRERHVSKVIRHVRDLRDSLDRPCS